MTGKYALSFLALALSVSGAFAQGVQPTDEHPHGPPPACAQDFASLCPGLTRGQELHQCIQSNFDKLSQGCKQAMAERRQHHGGDIQQGPGVPGSPPAGK